MVSNINEKSSKKFELSPLGVTKTNPKHLLIRWLRLLLPHMFPTIMFWLENRLLLRCTIWMHGTINAYMDALTARIFWGQKRNLNNSPVFYVLVVNFETTQRLILASSSLALNNNVKYNEIWTYQKYGPCTTL